MKKLEFETSKGKFFLVDGYIENGIDLKNITEEQASDIVDKVMNEQHFKNYNYKYIEDRWCKTASKSLFSLLDKNKIYLFENPLKVGTSKIDYSKYKEAEQNTFYNPYIFKI